MKTLLICLLTAISISHLNGSEYTQLPPVLQFKNGRPVKMGNIVPIGMHPTLASTTTKKKNWL